MPNDAAQPAAPADAEGLSARAGTASRRRMAPFHVPPRPVESWRSPSNPARMKPTIELAALNDPELLLRCVERDEASWSTLVERYRGLVFSTALTVGLDDDDAGDVFQHVWVELYRSLPRFRNPRALPRWLMVATRRHAYKLAAERRRVVRESYHELTDPKALPDEAVEAGESRRLVERGLEELDSRCRRFLRLLFFSNPTIPYDELARKTKMAMGSIGPTRARCLEKLRRAIGERP